MYSDFQVKIPDSHSGISQKTIRGTTYVYYSYSRKYDPVKKYTVAHNTSIGKIEERMAEFAKINDIILGGDELYMSAKQLRHSLRASKEAKDLVVSKEELISFPARRFTMELYYDGECFIYTDGKSKFIVHPNYKMKISREIVKRVNFITASRRIDKMEFNGKRYIKIGTDCNDD